MSIRKRTRRYQHGSLAESPDGKRWIVKYYPAPGKQTTKTLWPEKRHNSKASGADARRSDQAAESESVRPSRGRDIRALRRGCFLPDEARYRLAREHGERVDARNSQTPRSVPGRVQVCRYSAALLRAFLKAKAEQGLGKGTVNHLRFYLTDICRSATAEGYLMNDVSEGLRAPKKLLKPGAPKEVATLEQYAETWSLLHERERLCFDLVMFCGMRESEAFALWCGDVNGEGIHIERSFYKGLYGSPKTPKRAYSGSRRDHGAPAFLDFTVAGERADRLRLSVVEIGQANLAGELAEQICASAFAASGSRVGQLRGAAPVTLCGLIWRITSRAM